MTSYFKDTVSFLNLLKHILSLLCASNSDISDYNGNTEDSDNDNSDIDHDENNDINNTNDTNDNNDNINNNNDDQQTEKHNLTTFDPPLDQWHDDLFYKPDKERCAADRSGQRQGLYLLWHYSDGGPKGVSSCE